MVMNCVPSAPWAGSLGAMPGFFKAAASGGKPIAAGWVGLEELDQLAADLVLALVRFVRPIIRAEIILDVEEAVLPRRRAVGPQIWPPRKPRRGEFALARVEIQLRIAFNLP